MALPNIISLEGDLLSEQVRSIQGRSLYGNNDDQENRESNSTEPLHSQGCPKYKVLVKLSRQSRSPIRNQTTLHPKPWGARDPQLIPCTCGLMASREKKSPPGSVQASPNRDIRSVLRSESLPPLKKPPSPVRDPALNKMEGLKLFDEFCDRSDKLGVKFSSATLDSMCNIIRAKFGTRRLSVSPIRSSGVERRSIAKAIGNPTQPRQSAIEREPPVLRPPSVLRGKVEARNVMVEVVGPDFPQPGAAFPNISGPSIPLERLFNYNVALGEGRQFSSPDMIPTIWTMSDSADTFIPTREMLSPPPKRRCGLRSSVWRQLNE